MIYLLDCDLNGADSVQRLIDSGAVTHLQCGSFPEFEGHCLKLLETVSNEDLVICDTLSKLADTTRGDMKLGVDMRESLWEKRNVYFSDKNYLTVYEAAGQEIMRRLRNLRSRGARIITTCHEDEQLDPTTMTKKRAPALNDALYKSLMGSSSDVFRLRILTEEMVDKEGKIILPKYSRILQLQPDDFTITKFHVDPEVAVTIPQEMAAPTLPKLYKRLQKRPSWLVIYAPPGAGKTTLACSEATLQKKAQ
jgi:hypothetical protein